MPFGESYELRTLGAFRKFKEFSEFLDVFVILPKFRTIGHILQIYHFSNFGPKVRNLDDLSEFRTPGGLLQISQISDLLPVLGIFEFFEILAPGSEIRPKGNFGDLSQISDLGPVFASSRNFGLLEVLRILRHFRTLGPFWEFNKF